MSVYRSIVARPAMAVFPPAGEARKTVCVLGSPRGGTSMVAGLLHKLGVPMGETLDPANIEDQAFLGHGGVREIFTAWRRTRQRSAYLACVKAVVAQRNEQHPVWGWKDPLSSHYIAALRPALVNPYFVFVTRDINAIAGREQLEEGMVFAQTVFDYLEGALDQYRKTIRFLRFSGRPTLLVSYERALRAPAELASALARFLELEMPPGIAQWAAAYVTADRGDAALGSAALVNLRAANRVASDNLFHLLEESGRLAGETYLQEQFKSEAESLDAARNLAARAAAALTAGEALECRRNCFAVLQLHARSRPSIRDGLLGMVADALTGSAAEAVYPDLVCRSVDLIGRAYLAEGHATLALAYLQAAALLMRISASLAPAGPSTDPEAYWSCLYHTGLAAQETGRNDILADIREKFAAREMNMPATPAFIALLQQVRREFDPA